LITARASRAIGQHLLELVAFPFRSVEVVYERHNAELRARRSNVIGHRALRERIVFAESSIRAIQVKRFSDDDIEILDVLFERAHARLIPVDVKAESQRLTKSGVGRLSAKPSRAFAAFDFQFLSCFSICALAGSKRLFVAPLTNQRPTGAVESRFR